MMDQKEINEFKNITRKHLETFLVILLKSMKRFPSKIGISHEMKINGERYRYQLVAAHEEHPHFTQIDPGKSK